jgi:hypothetical protein
LSKNIKSTLILNSEPSVIIDVLQSEKFNLAKANNIDSIESSFKKNTNDETITTELYRALEPKLPEIVESLIGKQVKVYERIIWKPGVNVAQLDVSIDKAPIEIVGNLTLERVNQETKLEIDLVITSNLPFIGTKVEQFAEKIWTDISQKEFSLLVDWLKPQI